MSVLERIEHFMAPVSGDDIDAREKMTIEELENVRRRFLKLKLPTYGVIPSSIIAGAFEIKTLQLTDSLIGAFILVGISFPHFMRLINVATGTKQIKETMKDKR